MSSMTREATAERRLEGQAKNVQDEIQSLQAEVSKLASQLADLVTMKGTAAWRRAKTNVDSVISEAQAKGGEAVDAVRDVSDNMVDAIDESLRRRPYTTLLLAVAVGFVFGATWRR